MNNSSSRKYTNRRIRKEEEVIDLTDTSGNNSMPVIRELETDPVTGCVTMRSATDPPKQGGAFEDTPIHFVEEDKGQGFNNEPHTPPDPDDNYEDKLEAEGAFIINSTTYFPASNTRITKRSQTPEERTEQRMFEYYIDR